ncbi:Protein CHROMATIN REMODELING like [Actinidia chinensis var. chinensis]|uniref:Protein CHROMATIN REMODELING like n=1 Tax=Actinidia chinensis var. chinensis TaxID=1590841 RepID=A0A2R6R6P7_ACTCC|nr:Protein CHROMATIN REMODELING like [Actinidia chinensis var. chinensis]
MESTVEGLTNSYANPLAAKFQPVLYYKRRKRMKSPREENLHGKLAPSGYMGDEHVKKARTASQIINYTDPFAVPNLLDELERGKFGSVTNEIKDLLARRAQTLNSYFGTRATILDVEKNGVKEASKVNWSTTSLACQDVIELDDDDDDDGVPNDFPAERLQVIVIDLDNDETGDQRCFNPYQGVVLNNPAGECLARDWAQHQSLRNEDACFAGENETRKDKGVYVRVEDDKQELSGENETKKDKGVSIGVENDMQGLTGENETRNDKGVYLGVEDDTQIEEGNCQAYSDCDGLADIWKEMNFSLECSKDTAEDPLLDEYAREELHECDHSFVLKDDIGCVCRICGVIQRGIETIIEYQYPKGKRTTRSYSYESWTMKDKEPTEIFRDGVKLSAQGFIVSEVSAHPRHMKQMKPHQVEGFNFLLSNLVAEHPGGCIMAHAPGSGKTFMIISFVQSFLAKYPHARPLVVLPKGILTIWKREFQRWQVEDIPLYDFYSVKADNRSQQLEVLKQWADHKSILFLGYKQFSSIVCDSETSKTATACQDILLTHPSILILDEGHTPRNEDTDVLNSLKKVQTPRKVVLSGTLYQNHVKEVFNIFDLVRPKFMRLENSRAIMRRILSRVSSTRKHVTAKDRENVFFESVEHTLQKDGNFKRKIAVIQDLREMTSKVLHFYKGDFLDELPGLVDFTVLLNLSPRQKNEVEELKKLGRKFKISSDGSALYVHPQLRSLLKNSSTKERDGPDDAKMDQILEKLDVREGVKAKFFLNLIGLCESSGEKLLVFSQYLQPLKFLERLAMKVKGWILGKEIFVITGDSSSESREWSMDRFNTSPDARVFFGSIKACGEGISLVGASRIIILDVHLNPSVVRQAIGRAFRPGQGKKVYTYRLVAAGAPEEEDHSTCFTKEFISKMWFEWNEYSGQQEFEMETVNVNDCGDQFLESPKLSEDVRALYRR